MPHLSGHINVWESCLRILKERGYRLWLEGEDEEQTSDCVWCAEKNVCVLCAENPIELLGLASIYEFKGQPKEPLEPYWWVVEGEEISEQLIEEKWPESD